MKQVGQIIILLFIFLIPEQVSAHPKLKTANLGEFHTVEGNTIQKLKITYRTFGVLNEDRSNAVLWPTWFTGTSEDIFKSDILINIIDTKDLFIIAVDSLGNGVSSSPSNTTDFPSISIQDMVNSQYSLLVKHLDIQHLYAVIGISMGGMQALEWAVSYPNFMDKVISIIGTPKQSAFDVLFWQTQIALIESASSNKASIDFAIKRAYDIFYMNLTTPTDFSIKQSPENVQKYMAGKYDNMIDSEDYLSMAKAMIKHNIYRGNLQNFENINSIIKADTLLIVSESDHIVNPLSSIVLAEKLGGDKLLLTGNNGHMAAFLQTKEIFKKTSLFLK
jgi:homoserine O-acetyltransferase